MSVQIRRPARQIFYPPTYPAPVDHYDYVTGDSWKRIADMKARQVWNLILYNFQVRNPEEVNWCMKEFFGCTESNDGKNFSFRTKDTNRRVFIPPADFNYLDDRDTEMRDLVLAALGKPEVAALNFQLDGVLVDFRLLNDIRKLILSNSILVMELVDGTAPETVVAQWNPTLNILFVRHGPRTQTRMALAIHEAVHAGLDLRRVKGRTKLGEACAHVAEAIFGMSDLTHLKEFDPFALPVPKHRQWAAFVAQQSVLHNLATNTTYVLDGTEPILRSLLEYVAIWPTYVLTANDTIVADGI